MPTEQPEGFADNWAYLKMELRWLDQVLMLAVTRQRKENHEIDRITHAKVDRATSSWWKGIISTEGKAVYDEYRQPSTGGTKVTYQQQLEGKVQASRGGGIQLGLPNLRDRLGLTLFEKNLVLMSLAPEINRRYARLYRYLQGDEAGVKTDLPTLDLVLRLMCRNDVEWRDARHRLVTTSPLVQHQLLYFSPALSDSLLNCPLKLAEPLVNYLLAEHPTDSELSALLHASATSSLRSTLLIQGETAVDWSDLVLSSPLLSSLQSLVQRIQGQTHAATRWGWQAHQIAGEGSAPIGSIAVLAGARGTGKTMAAAAIAHALNTPLSSLDLAQIDDVSALPQLLEEIMAEAPTVLLLKSAHLWFGRSSPLPSPTLHRFLSQRQQTAGITLLSVEQANSIQFQWRQIANQVMGFSLPNLSDRLQLWQKAFPFSVPLSSDIDWKVLAQIPLSGGEIMAIAQDSIFCAAAEAEQVEMHHLVKVLEQWSQRLPRSFDPPLPPASLPQKSKTNKTKTAPAKPSKTPEAQSIPSKTNSSKAASTTQSKKRKQAS